MSKADIIFAENCRQILDGGVWDKDYNVRPRWEDGEPAYTIKRFGIVNRYDLSEEFPILTLRRTFLKTAVDEHLWIWQKKSSNIKDLGSRIWDEWADENGSIGKAYGYQLGVKHIYPEGEFDQVDRIIYDLKHNPSSRRIMSNIYNHADLNEMRLYPCASICTRTAYWHTFQLLAISMSCERWLRMAFSLFPLTLKVMLYAQGYSRISFKSARL